MRSAPQYHIFGHRRRSGCVNQRLSRWARLVSRSSYREVSRSMRRTGMGGQRVQSADGGGRGFLIATLVVLAAALALLAGTTLALSLSTGGATGASGASSGWLARGKESAVRGAESTVVASADGRVDREDEAGRREADPRRKASSDTSPVTEPVKNRAELIDVERSTAVTSRRMGDWTEGSPATSATADDNAGMPDARTRKYAWLANNSVRSYLDAIDWDNTRSKDENAVGEDEKGKVLDEERGADAGEKHFLPALGAGATPGGPEDVSPWASGRRREMVPSSLVHMAGEGHSQGNGPRKRRAASYEMRRSPDRRRSAGSDVPLGGTGAGATMTLGDLQEQLQGDITTDFTWGGAGDVNLPKLGQDVATGESRTRGTSKIRSAAARKDIKKRGRSKGRDKVNEEDGGGSGGVEKEASSIDPNNLQWYDPAFVDSETEYRTRSGRAKMLTEFFEPLALNYTVNTGRLRRLGRTLYLDGKPWLMRALCYSPIPVGWDPDWFEPYGDFFTSEYAGIYERDIPLIAAAGINTLRIYTLKYSHRHTHFFDLCRRYGIEVIVGYEFLDGTKSIFNDEESMKSTQTKIRKLIRAAKHPAVVAWIIGNELNGPWNLFVCDRDLAENFGISGCQFDNRVEKLMKSIDLLCEAVRQEGMMCGTALANVNLPVSKQHLVGMQLWGAAAWIKLADRYMTNLDFWGVNLYTRRYFSPMGLFQRFHLVSKRPLIISEYGVDAFGLSPQLEGWNAYDTMGSEDEVSQADWLITMVEDLERHATTCAAGCATRFISGGAIMSWVDEYWKGKAVTPVPTTDERVPTITRVCPSLKEYIHSPCGYASPTQPDLYVSEEWFGIMAVKKRCSINKVDLLRPRAAYFLLKLIWGEAGSCTPFIGQDPDKMPYDPQRHLNCGRAMKSYILRNMETFMRAEAEAFHQINLVPNQPVPIFAHFENFSAMLNHPKGVINPVSSSLQSSFFTCYAQSQIHKRSPQTCPEAPKIMENIAGYVSKQSSEFRQPGDTSCPEQAQVDAMKLEVQLKTVVILGIVLYLVVALLLKRKQLTRMLQDAMISLVRAGLPGVRYFVTAPSPDEPTAKAEVENIIKSQILNEEQLASELHEEPAADSTMHTMYGDGPSLSRAGPPPSGGSHIELGIKAWRKRVTPIVENLGNMFGSQGADVYATDADAPGATREIVIDRMAKTLWNLSQLADAPSVVTGAACATGPVAEFAISKLHETTLAGYIRWLDHTGFEDLSPAGETTLGSKAARSVDTKLHQIVLFELLYTEAANCRHLPEMLSFTYHAAACAVAAPSGFPGTASATRNSGLPLPSGDFIESIIMPFHDVISESMDVNKRLHKRVGYDDINEAFWNKETIKKMLSMEAMGGATSAYAKFRQFLRSAAAATEQDQRLASIFKKTFREHLGWGMVFCSFYRIFTFLSLAFHLLVVHAFSGFKDPLLYFSAAITAAFCNFALEIHCLLIHRQELMWSRRTSMIRAMVAGFIMGAALAAMTNLLSATVFHLICAPYFLFTLIELLGMYPLGAPKSDHELVGKKSRGDLNLDDPADRRTYMIFWGIILLVKFGMDYVFIVHSLVVPSRAIMQIDLYCWNYNFAGEDCDVYDSAELLPEAVIHVMRFLRRYGYKFLMLFERWLPNLMLYYANTLFYYIIVLGFASAYDRLRWRGVADGWPKLVKSLPKKVAAFEKHILAKEVKSPVESSPATVLCAEAVSEGWDMFACAWNEVVRSLRDRDLLSNEEMQLLVFHRLRGPAVNAFFGGAVEAGGARGYLLFPAMLIAPVFTKAGASRNVNMTYPMLPLVFAQMTDVATFLLTAVLGVCDGKHRTALRDTLRAALNLTACAVVRRQASAADDLIDLRGHVLKLFNALCAARTAAAAGQPIDTYATAAEKAVNASLDLVVKRLANDRDKEDAAGKDANRLLRGVLSRVRELLKLERLRDIAHVRKRLAPALLTAPARALTDHVSVLLSTSNPAGEPASQEAHGVLCFFLESLTDPQLTRGAPVKNMPSLVTLTPVYAEEVTYTGEDLRQTVDGENVSTLRFIISMMPTEWSAMLQRAKLNLPQQNYESLLDELHNGIVGTRGGGVMPRRRHTAEDRRLLSEICTWASGRSQTVMRTVRGLASYADATRVLARLEGLPETDIEPLVAAKFNHLVCAQVYGAEGMEEKDAQMDELLALYPHLSIVHMQYTEEGKVELDEYKNVQLDTRRTTYFLVHRRAKFDAQGNPTGIAVAHKIKLPGFPIIGEGKPENQNLGMAVATGMYVQTIDMNQDAHLAEGLKLRNVLVQFVGNTRLVGFPEQMLTDRSGSVASFAALSEQVFGTIVQRFMAKPLNVRFHYGHPDVWDLTWVRGQGGLSKATKQLHLSEDIFGGMNLVLRGGRVKYLGFKMVGKAREVSFDGTNQFNFKIASGNGMQLISRDFHRLAKHFDLFRLMSFFQSSAGLFFTEWMLFASLSAFVVCKVMIAMLHVETFFGDGDAFDSVGFHEEIGLEVLYPSQWMIQASLVMAWPSMLEGWLDGGFVKMLQRVFQHASSGAHIYNMFIAKTRGYAIDLTVLSGKAYYQRTRRGMRMQATFVSLYTRYAASHITPSMEMATLTVLITLLSRYNALYVFVMTSYHVWFAVFCLTLSPWLFHPQSFKEGMVWQGFVEWMCWIDFAIEREGGQARSTGVANTQGLGSWSTWHAERLSSLRKMDYRTKIDYVMYRLVPVPLMLLAASCAALHVDDVQARPTLRSIIILTSGIAGVLLSVIYYWATSPSFLWPHRILNTCMRIMPSLGVVEKHFVVLIYGLVVKVAVVIFHQMLCSHLFAGSIDTNNFTNGVIFFVAGFLMVTILACSASIISDHPPFLFRPIAVSLRHFADSILLEVDICQGMIVHTALGLISLLPISYIHGKILFNRAYAAVLGVEMRRRRVIGVINAMSTHKSMQQVYVKFRNFIRQVLGLRAITMKFARPMPTCVPNLADDLTKKGPVLLNTRQKRIAARITPIAENIATLFGLQKTCSDSTFTDEPVEVPSNLANSIVAMSHWLSNIMDQREGMPRDRETDEMLRDAVDDLHSHVFQNYLHWVDYTGMMDQVNAQKMSKRWNDNPDENSRHKFMLAAFMFSDNEALWNKNNREHSVAVMLNARIHHICLWYLFYGESANLRHTPELMCYIFHSAMCALELEDRFPDPCPFDGTQPTGTQLVLAQPVAGSGMPYAADDYLNSIVRPLYQFLQREILTRASAPIVNRVMYDDVNEFFWLQERFKVLLPPADGHAGANEQGWVGVPLAMRSLPVEQRLYAHMRAFMQKCSVSEEGAAEALSKVFFKTHRELAGWMSMFVNFNTIFLFHAVAFHVSMAVTFAHGWNWEYISTATITHSIMKLLNEIAILNFRNLSQESSSDWAVVITRSVAFAMIPIFYCLERLSREDSTTPYFQALASVYAVAFAGIATSSVRREPFLGSTKQFMVPIRERMIYTVFWVCVLSVKLLFGHYLLVTPLREAIMALQHPDLCWNKESDEYTSCIHLEGDALMNALRFTPKTTYFMDRDKDEDYDYELEDSLHYESLEPLNNGEKPESESPDVATGESRGGGSRKKQRRPLRLRARRRSLLTNSRLASGNVYAPLQGGRTVRYYLDVPEHNAASTEIVRIRSSGDDAVSSDTLWRVARPVAADIAYKSHPSASYAAPTNCSMNYGDEGWGGPGCEDGPGLQNNLNRTLALPALGYIGEEIEGEIPEAYYDVHASVELMWIMTIIRALPALTTYFCDTFLWYTCFATLFTVFLQWRRKITHAQNWAYLLRTFATIPGLFCDKLINRDWPKPEIVHGDSKSGGSSGASGGSGDDGAGGHGSMGMMDPVGAERGGPRNKSGGGYEPTEFVMEFPVEFTSQHESAASIAGADPVDFLPEAMDIKWQHFARAWNSIIHDLRDRDHLSNTERDDLSFTILKGRDVEQIFDAPEYVVLPPMMTSPVFSISSLNTGRMDEYTSFDRTLVQTKDLLCVVLVEVLGVVRPKDMHTLMKLVVDLARVEAQQMSRRRRDDIGGYVRLRESTVRLLLALQSLAVATTATPAPEPDDDADDNDDGKERDPFASEDDSEEEDATALARLTLQEQEQHRRRRERKERRRKKREIQAAEEARGEKLMEAINLEMKYGCTGFLSKSTRKSIKKKGGMMAGCFVVDEDLEATAQERRDELRRIEREERRERGLASDEDGNGDAKGSSSRRARRRRRYRRGRRVGPQDREWVQIAPPGDLMEVHGERIASALHDVLLAVRELCSFAMEQDGRWSSANNQRKYRISQLYSFLLDMIHAESLRDPEHLRKVAAAATTPLANTTCACLLRALNNSNPGGQPRSAEAQRQLMFFCNSLRFTSLETPSPVAQVRSWTALVPYYAEDVKYRLEDLTKPLEDEKTLFSLIVATFPDDYDNFKERVGLLGMDDNDILRDHWSEVQAWASDRTQSLYRCVRGVTLYGSAMRLLARLEGHAEEEVESLVRSKFEFLVSCQIFGKMKKAELGSLDRFKASAIEELIRDNPDLKVCFVHIPSDPSEDFASCLVGKNPDTNELCIDFKVKLPGNPIIGEGKPENQNHAVIFARGGYLQTLDMNQDNYMGESYKMRNLLDCFHSNVVLVGFPEAIFSETHGAVAQFAAISEFIFQTFQRLMTWPLMVRFHYGHPDVWDKGFTMTNGGVSKASRALHVAEDFFGGANAVSRGGKVIFEEFIECGKGRDMGFTSVNGFEQKISGSSGTISMSRDLFRLHRGMDTFRIFSLFFSGPGFFIAMMQTAWCVYLYILAHATLAMADLEIYRVYRYFKMTETQTSLSLSKEEGGYYNSIYAIQLGLLTILPLFLKMTVDRGLRDGIEYTLSTLFQGSWAFNIFAMGTKGYNYMRALIFGQAQYIATERGYVLQNASMVVLYGLYAKSHLYNGMELLFYLVLFHTHTCLPKSILYTWSVWMFAFSTVIAPWWFSPQAANLFWMQQSWMDWRRWIDGNFPNPKISNGSWYNWHAHMLANWREMLSPWYKVCVTLTSSFGRIVLCLVCTASLHGNVQIDGIPQVSQFSVNLMRMFLAMLTMMAVCVLYYIVMRSDALARRPWLAFPEHLWKLSVYRGMVRVMISLTWLGMYAIFMYDEVEGVSSLRTLTVTVLGCVAWISVIMESWVMIGNRDINHMFGFLMPPPPLEDEVLPPVTWRNRTKPVVLFVRSWLQRLRDFADFWFCENDKLIGTMIFAMLFVLSLLPIATLQAVLIWNETFSDVINQRVAVQECVTEIIA